MMPHRFSFTRLPGTPFVYLTDDSNMAHLAPIRGTIVIEQELADLPEVKALTRQDFVLDVGAFIGDTAIIFGKSGARVLAFEPQFDAYCAALVNTAGFENIRVLNIPVGNFELVQANQDPIAGNLGTRTVSTQGGALSLACCLDGFDLIDERVTFVKIDVEGFEPSVIQGAIGLFERDKPTLLIEVYPEMLARHGFSVGDVIDPLEKLGYTIKQAIGNHSEPRWDIICSHPDRE